MGRGERRENERMRKEGTSFIFSHNFSNRELRVPYEWLDLQDKIGEGNFGNVYRTKLCKERVGTIELREGERMEVLFSVYSRCSLLFMMRIIIVY